MYLLYMILHVNKITDNEEKVKMLILLGASTLVSLMSKISYPKEPESCNYDDIMTKLEVHLKPTSEPHCNWCGKNCATEIKERVRVVQITFWR